MSSVDNLFGVVQVFVVFILMAGVMVFWNTVTDDVQLTSTLWNSNPTTQGIKAHGDEYFNRQDNILFLGYLGIHLGIIVLSFLLRSHPVMYVFGFVITLILLILSPILSNAYNDVMDNPAFAEAQADLPKAHIIMNNLPKWEFLWAVLTSIVMYGLAKYEGFA